MERVRMMECGDGFRRADNASAGPVAAKTAAYTILPGEQTSVFTNLAAAGSVTITLPSAVGLTGRRFFFIKATAGQNLVVAGTIKHNVTPFTLATLTHSTADEFAAVEVIAYNSAWHVVNTQGTWAAA